MQELDGIEIFSTRSVQRLAVHKGSGGIGRTIYAVRSRTQQAPPGFPGEFLGNSQGKLLIASPFPRTFDLYRCFATGQNTCRTGAVLTNGAQSLGKGASGHEGVTGEGLGNQVSVQPAARGSLAHSLQGQMIRPDQYIMDAREERVSGFGRLRSGTTASLL